MDIIFKVKAWLTKLFGYDLYRIVKPISKEEVIKAQRLWASGIMRIGRIYRDGGNYVTSASKMIDKLYSYEDGEVLFKPTNAKEDQFRIEKDEALSYFIGNKEKGNEDKGFAIHNWEDITFGDDQYIILNRTFAVAMGNYFFTDAKTKKVEKLEYTFGYKRSDSDNHLEIFLHHSSHPYKS